MRRVLDILYPQTIHCTKHGRKFPFPFRFKKVGWKLFGYILQDDPEIPVNMAMQFYFTKNTDKLKGRLNTRLPVKLNDEMKSSLHH